LRSNWRSAPLTTGAHFKSGLQALAADYPDLISAVRGAGLMIGMDMVSSDVSQLFIAYVLQQHVLVAFALNQPGVIRIEPPLTMPVEVVDEVLDRLRIALDATRSVAEQYGLIQGSAAVPGRSAPSFSPGGVYMTEIHVSRLINRPVAEVFAVAQQVERFPDVLPDLDKVEILENDGAGNTVTRWQGTVALGPLTRKIGWTERDRWDTDALTCTFELVEGDMKQFSGVWTFVPASTDATQVDLRVQFELGIPVLGPMVNRIVDELMKKNCEDLLDALERLSA
jgi:ribosome-associated toxin RatA of RatAB toxin-antitoxin module